MRLQPGVAAVMVGQIKERKRFVCKTTTKELYDTGMLFSL
jgi:hypothetical protein